MGRFGSAVVILLVTAISATAQRSSDFDDCDSNVPERQLRGCTRIIETEKKNKKLLSQAHNNRGNAYAAIGDLDKALADTNKAVALDPKDPVAHHNLSRVLMHRKDLEKALTAIDTALSIEPDNANFLLQRASILERLGDYNKMLFDIEKAVKLNPADAALLASRGFAHANKNNFEIAVADFDQAIRLNKDFSAAYRGRGWAHLKAGRVDEALRDLDEAIRLDRNDGDAYRIRAEAKSLRGQFKDAKADLSEVVRLTPNESYPYYLRSIAEKKLSELDAAMLDINRAIEISDSAAGYFQTRALLHYQRGDLEKALSDIEETIRLAPHWAPGHNARAWYLFRSGRLDEASADVERALKIDPKDGLILDTRAHIRLARGETEAALSDFGKAIEFGGAGIVTYQGRGAAYEKVGQADKARADYRKALEIGADDDDDRETQRLARERLAVLDAAAPAGGSATDSPGLRVALVIGINKYQHWAGLTNPARDAHALAVLLRENGFQAIELIDPDFVTFHDAVSDFETMAAGAEVALAYYAGHGMQVGDKNILAPVDMPDICGEPQAKRAIELEALFRAIKPARKKIVLLDACRNNPFPRCPKRSSESGGGFRALGRVEGSGLLIVNSTSPGSLAEDGLAGEGSPFARSLLVRLRQHPGRDLKEVLALVSEDVEKATGGGQLPEVTLRGSVPKTCLASAGCAQ